MAEVNLRGIKVTFYRQPHPGWIGGCMRQLWMKVVVLLDNGLEKTVMDTPVDHDEYLSVVEDDEWKPPVIK